MKQTRHRLARLVATSLGAVIVTVAGTASLSTAAGDEIARNPLLTYALPDGDRIRFDGRVVERLDAGSYVYLAIEREDGSRAWVVTLASSRGAAAGLDAVRVVALGHAEHFASKRLSRSFDDLYFAVVRPG